MDHHQSYGAGPSGGSSGNSSQPVPYGAGRWYWTADQLAKTPSIMNGITYEKELSYRQQAANFIQDMGQKLKVTQLCINTGIVYMQRFYMFHSFYRFHRNDISVAALFLAAKVEEQPRKLEHVIKVAHICLHRDQPTLDTRSQEYIERAQMLVTNENLLLQTLGFDVNVVHPHTHVVKYCQLLKTQKDLAHTSYFMATNSLHLTTMCLRYSPTVVACFCIHIACEWAQTKLPMSAQKKMWYEHFDSTVTLDLLQTMTKEFMEIFQQCPSRLKRKIKASEDFRTSQYQPDGNTTPGQSASQSQQQLQQQTASASSSSQSQGGHQRPPQPGQPLQNSQQQQPAPPKRPHMPPGLPPGSQGPQQGPPHKDKRMSMPVPGHPQGQMAAHPSQQPRRSMGGGDPYSQRGQQQQHQGQRHPGHHPGQGHNNPQMNPSSNMPPHVQKSRPPARAPQPPHGGGGGHHPKGQGGQRGAPPPPLMGGGVPQPGAGMPQPGAGMSASFGQSQQLKGSSSSSIQHQQQQLMHNRSSGSHGGYHGGGGHRQQHQPSSRGGHAPPPGGPTQPQKKKSIFDIGDSPPPVPIKADPMAAGQKDQYGQKAGSGLEPGEIPDQVKSEPHIKAESHIKAEVTESHSKSHSHGHHSHSSHSSSHSHSRKRPPSESSSDKRTSPVKQPKLNYPSNNTSASKPRPSLFSPPSSTSSAAASSSTVLPPGGGVSNHHGVTAGAIQGSSERRRTTSASSSSSMSSRPEVKLPKLEDTSGYETFKDPHRKTVLLSSGEQAPASAVKSMPVSIPMTGITSDVIKQGASAGESLLLKSSSSSHKKHKKEKKSKKDKKEKKDRDRHGDREKSHKSKHKDRDRSSSHGHHHGSSSGGSGSHHSHSRPTSTTNPDSNPDSGGSASPDSAGSAIGGLPKLKIKFGNGEPPAKIEGTNSHSSSSQGGHGHHHKGGGGGQSQGPSKMSRAMGTSVENEALFLANTAKIPKKIK